MSIALPPRRWPMTSDAWSALLAELALLERHLDTTGAAPIVGLRAIDPERRRRTLRAVRDGADTTPPADRVAIGRSVTIREADGTVETYALTLPGDGDPLEGWISADSPLGTAVLGRRPGDEVEIEAPGGRRRVAIVAVT
jgi:transcription elongation GreA/GreB family factor